MTYWKSSEIYHLSMTTLQQGFAMHCKLLGLRKNTCIALTLMLNSKELLIAMSKFMAEIEGSGRLEDMDKDDTTTMVVYD